MTSQSEADQEFKRIAVEAQPPGTVINPLACVKPQITPTPSTVTVPGDTANALTVNVTFPNPDSNGLLRSTSDL